PFPARVAVGTGRKGPAPPPGREGAQAAQEDRRPRLEDQLRTAGQGDLTAAVAELVEGDRDGRQRRGAGGIDGDVRAPQSEYMRDPAARHRGGGPGPPVGADLLVAFVTGEDRLVVGSTHPDED